MLASVTGYAMDGFDLLILGFMLPAITSEFGLSSSQSGSLVTWTLIGAVLGGVAGNAVFGSTLGTVGGAAAGALIGNEVGKKR